MKNTNSVAKRDNSENQTSRRKALYLICLLCLIILLIIIFAYLLPRSEDTANNGIVGFYCSNDRLNVFGDAVIGVYEIDTSNNSHDKIVDEAANSLYADEDYIIYDNGCEVIAVNRKANSKKVLFSFDANTPEKVKFHKNAELLGTPPIRRVGDIGKSGERIYFSYCISYELMPDEHTNIGEEMWNYIYSYNLETDETEIIKSSYYITPEIDHNNNKNYTSISNMNVKGDDIYYSDRTAVYRIDIETENEAELFRCSEPIINLFWRNDGFDAFIWSDTGDVDCVRIDNFGNVIFSCPARTISNDFFPQDVFYDVVGDRYLYMSDSKLKSVSFSDGSSDELSSEIEMTRKDYRLSLSDIYYDGDSTYLLFAKMHDYKPCGFTVLGVKDSKDIYTILDITD